MSTAAFLQVALIRLKWMRLEIMVPLMKDSTIRLLAMAMLVLGLSGCASRGDYYEDERDPWMGFNRAVYTFNEGADTLLLTPIAETYRAITPGFVDRGVSNFFSNLDDVTVFINNVLQFKLRQASSDFGRFAFNSTAGVLGLWDVATPMGFEKHEEDFGQTLGAWGVGPGPYLVLPILGPSTLRDAIGKIPDTLFFDPIAYVEHDRTRWTMYALKYIDLRADLLTATNIIDEASLDPYEFTRDAFLQRREYLVHDGNPPIDPEDEFDPLAPFP